MFNIIISFAAFLGLAAILFLGTPSSSSHSHSSVSPSKAHTEAANAFKAIF